MSNDQDKASPSVSNNEQEKSDDEGRKERHCFAEEAGEKVAADVEAGTARGQPAPVRQEAGGHGSGRRVEGEGDRLDSDLGRLHDVNRSSDVAECPVWCSVDQKCARCRLEDPSTPVATPHRGGAGGGAEEDVAQCPVDTCVMVWGHPGDHYPPVATAIDGGCSSETYAGLEAALNHLDEVRLVPSVCTIPEESK